MGAALTSPVYLCRICACPCLRQSKLASAVPYDVTQKLGIGGEFLSVPPSARTQPRVPLTATMLWMREWGEIPYAWRKPCCQRKGGPHGHGFTGRCEERPGVFETNGISVARESPSHEMKPPRSFAIVTRSRERWKDVCTERRGGRFFFFFCLNACFFLFCFSFFEWGTRSGSISDHLGLFNVRLNRSTRLLFAFGPDRSATATAGNRTSALELSSATPYVLNYHGWFQGSCGVMRSINVCAFLEREKLPRLLFLSLHLGIYLVDRWHA